jgi:hypothetical protein
MTIRRRNLPSLAISALLGLALACSGSSSGPSAPQHTGQSCTTASQCYPGLDAAALLGQATCLTQVTNGYCTHTCTSDSDCCAIPGECSGLTEVCAPFESTGQTYCFLSCAASNLPDGGTTDPSVYCQTWANAAFTCRSTGGGRGNALFCGP